MHSGQESIHFPLTSLHRGISLNEYYLQILRVGFLVIRQAADDGDSDWLRAELEFLHNIPSLIGETNVERHRYFWLQERDKYLSWIITYGSNRAKSRMQTYYSPILTDMTQIMEDYLRVR